jgi:hypothetical protein
MMATILITGTVAGFVLVIDPNNEKGKQERIEYKDATEMNAKQSIISREEIARYNADTRNYDMMPMLFFTQYKRDDNGVITEEEGFSPSGDVKVGDPAHLAKCKCGKTSWFKIHKDTGAYITGEYTCEDCNDNGGNEINDDFTNYDGRNVREY